MPEIVDLSSWLTLTMCLLVAGLLLYSDRRNPLASISPLRWLGISFLILHVIAPFNILWFDDLPYSVFRFEAFAQMAVASAIGGLMFWLGWRFKRYEAGKHEDILVETSSNFHIRQVIVLVPIAFLALIMLQNAYGSILTFAFTTQPASSFIESELFNVFSLLLAAFIPMISNSLIVSMKTVGIKRVMWVLILTLLSVLYVLITVKLGARYRLLFLVLPAFALYIAFHGPSLGLSSWILLSLFGAITYLVGRIRYQLSLVPSSIIETTVEYFSSLRYGLYYDIFMQGDFDAFQNGMQLFDIVPRVRPLMWGQTFLSVLYNPIPRALWAGKPTPSANQYMVQLGVGPAMVRHYNFAVSLIAELYANFWWIGIIVGMFILGHVAARFWNWFLLNRQKTEAWFHIGLFCAYLPVLLRGSFHAMTVYYLMVVVNEVISRRVAKFLPGVVR